jgi:transposase-like protein
VSAGEARATTEERERIVAAAIAEMLESGATLRQIAEKHGVPHSTLSRWLLSDAPAEYRDAQTSALLTRVVEADQALAAATTHIEINRAQAQCRFARQDLERRRPQMYGPRISQEISGPGGGPIVVMDDLERARRLAYVQSLVRPAIDVTPIASSSTDSGARRATAGAPLPSPFRGR